MWDNLSPALIITRREVRDQFRDWRIIVPIAVLTLFFPGLMNFTASQALNFVQDYGANLIAERFIPFLLMIVGFFPITVSLVIALESFAGETERRSIEPLLSTPLSNWQLYLGKLLASLVPPITASYLGILVYLIGIYRSVGWTPDPLFLVQIILLTTVQALVMVSGAVVVSTQTTSVRAANLLSSFIIIPMALLIQGESIIMFWGSLDILWWVIAGQAVVSGLLIRTGIAHFNREELLGRELDIINLRKGWAIFKDTFLGEARSVGEWYRIEVLKTLRLLSIPLVFMCVLLAAGTWIGADQANRLALPHNLFNLDQLLILDSKVLSGLKGMGFFSIGSVPLIWMHNLRAVTLATLLGIFSFGVFGVIILMLPLTIMGFIAGTATTIGFSPLIFLFAFTFPHGFLEIPAMVLTGAAILRVGATLVTPAQGRTISESFLCALADWAKIMIALVAPLFLGASILEVFITPRTALLLLGG